MRTCCLGSVRYKGGGRLDGTHRHGPGVPNPLVAPGALEQPCLRPRQRDLGFGKAVDDRGGVVRLPVAEEIRGPDVAARAASPEAPSAGFKVSSRPAPVGDAFSRNASFLSHRTTARWWSRLGPHRRIPRTPPLGKCRPCRCSVSARIRGTNHARTTPGEYPAPVYGGPGPVRGVRPRASSQNRASAIATVSPCRPTPSIRPNWVRRDREPPVWVVHGESRASCVTLPVNRAPNESDLTHFWPSALYCLSPVKGNDLSDSVAKVIRISVLIRRTTTLVAGSLRHVTEITPTTDQHRPEKHRTSGRLRSSGR